MNKLLLELVADSNGLLKGLSQAQSQVDRFTKSASSAGMSLGSGVNRALETFQGLAGGGANAAGALAGAFAAASTAAYAMTVQAGKIAEQTEQLAQKTGISATSLEGMSVAMARNGLEASHISTAIKGLSKSMGEMESGTKSGVELMRTLGITMETVEAGTGATMRAIADAFQKMPDGAEKARLAVELFGKSGLDLIPMLNKGAAGLDEAMKKAAEFGLILSDTARGDLTTFDDAMDDLQSALKGFTMQVGAAFAPSLTALVNGFTASIVGVKNLFNQFADAASTLTIRLAAMVTSVELLGRQLLSTNALSAESWKQTWEQVKAVDAWAASEIKAVEASRQSSAQLAQLAEAQMSAAKAADQHAVSQEKLGQHIVASTQIQLRQIEAAGKSQERQGAAIVAATQIENAMAEAEGKRQERLGRQINDELAVSQRIAQEWVDSYMVQEDAAMARFQAEMDAVDRNQEHLGRWIVAQTQAAQKQSTIWSTTMDQMEQSGAYAFGQIRNSFGQAVAGMALGTQTFKQFLTSMYGTILNATVQLGLNLAIEWAKSAALKLGTESATAGATVSIWGAASGAMVGIFGTVTGAIKGLFTSTIIPFFAAIGKALMTFLTAIAGAAKATIFGIPYGALILAGVAVIGAAIGSLMAFAFKDGGIATGPTMGLIGEAGSSEAVIPLNKRGAAFMRETLGMGGNGGVSRIEVPVYLDGRRIAMAVAQHTGYAWRKMGAPA